ncbi:MAG: hypothetical protein A3J28_07755 [Acidobacteria bacterium RIFCSPLOWO2_12_FULL_60_22]|nr:MAG: hypothetical protein A3J28_07755 [Acidobacteria bacterium RIFCSPLOWO2_12_FULL_60_22]
MDDLVRALAYEVFGLLEHYIQVHNDMLGRKWLAWLQPIDFEGNARKLTHIDQVLENARLQALELQSSSQALARHREYLRVLVSYVVALSDTVSILRDIAENMSKKARGGQYDMSQYQQDMDNYKVSVQRYKNAGEILKVAWAKAGL